MNCIPALHNWQPAQPRLLQREGRHRSGRVIRAVSSPWVPATLWANYPGPTRLYGPGHPPIPGSTPPVCSEFPRSVRLRPTILLPQILEVRLPRRRHPPPPAAPALGEGAGKHAGLVRQQEALHEVSVGEGVRRLNEGHTVGCGPAAARDSAPEAPVVPLGKEAGFSIHPPGNLTPEAQLCSSLHPRWGAEAEKPPKTSLDQKTTVKEPGTRHQRGSIPAGTQALALPACARAPYAVPPSRAGARALARWWTGFPAAGVCVWWSGGACHSVFRALLLPQVSGTANAQLGSTRARHRDWR